LCVCVCARFAARPLAQGRKGSSRLAAAWAGAARIGGARTKSLADGSKCGLRHGALTTILSRTLALLTPGIHPGVARTAHRRIDRPLRVCVCVRPPARRRCSRSLSLPRALLFSLVVCLALPCLPSVVSEVVRCLSARDDAGRPHVRRWPGQSRSESRAPGRQA
jgi:hypothetical protein